MKLSGCDRASKIHSLKDSFISSPLNVHPSARFEVQFERLLARRVLIRRDEARSNGNTSRHDYAYGPELDKISMREEEKNNFVARVVSRYIIMLFARLPMK